MCAVAVGGGTASCHSSASSTASSLSLGPADLFGEAATFELCTSSLLPATLMSRKPTAVELGMPEELAGAMPVASGVLRS